MDEPITYGIADYKAPELLVDQWIDADGKTIEPLRLNDFSGKFKVVYCFQSWCPGCHSRGFPALQKMTRALAGNDKIVFLAIQTVFEGHDANTYDKLRKTQKQYNLKIPFGHDAGDQSSHDRSKTMYHFRTGGTPWFIFIDQNNYVVFNDFHLDVDKAITFLKGVDQV